MGGKNAKRADERTNFDEEGCETSNDDDTQIPPEDLQPPKPNDISFSVGKIYFSAEKLRVLKNLWAPVQSFDFPVTFINQRRLRFQYNCPIRFKWLTYSQNENWAFCKYCVLFGRKSGAGIGNQPLGSLCAFKFQKWKNALERFAEHESSKYHQNSVVTRAGLRP